MKFIEDDFNAILFNLVASTIPTDVRTYEVGAKISPRKVGT
jgi:hypothetical protein